MFFPEHLQNLQRWLLVALLFLSAGCYTLDVERAFKGKFDVVENNRVINEYCQSCHIHSQFIPQTHVENMQKLYKKGIYRVAGECRVCHYLENQLGRDEFLRKTRRPRAVARGKFSSFEKKITRELRKNKRSGKGLWGLF